MRTRVAVTGLSEAEAAAGIPDLLAEFGERPWLLSHDARWHGGRLVVTVEADGGSLAVQGGTTGANLDEVWDCVIACVPFSSDRIGFEVEESRFVDDAGSA